MRKLAFDIVYGTMEQEQYADALFHRSMEKHNTLTTQQKSFVKRLAYGTIERSIEADEIIKRFSKVKLSGMDSTIRNILRMAIYEIFYMEQVPDSATCNEAVELVKRVKKENLSGFVNGILRNIVREKDNIELKEPWVLLNLPKALYEHFVSQYGKKTTKKIGTAFLERAGTTTLHINTNRILVEEYKRLLEEQRITYENGYYAEEAIRIENEMEIRKLPGYEEGYFFVQDESSMIPVLAANIKKDDIVVDVCSAPGGKTMHALQVLNGSGLVSSRDVSEKKVKRIQENISRMKFTGWECKVWDGTKTDEAWLEKADVVLADVPCSGIGIIGKKPEIKFHALKQAKDLVPLQRKICNEAVKMLKPGGTFIYSTCTINKEENEENVQWLVEHLGLKRDSLNCFIPENLRNKMTAEGMLQMLPGVQKSDGFFVARLIKE